MGDHAAGCIIAIVGVLIALKLFDVCFTAVERWWKRRKIENDLLVTGGPMGGAYESVEYRELLHCGRPMILYHGMIACVGCDDLLEDILALEGDGGPLNVDPRPMQRDPWYRRWAVWWRYDFSKAVVFMARSRWRLWGHVAIVGPYGVAVVWKERVNSENQSFS